MFYFMYSAVADFKNFPFNLIYLMLCFYFILHHYGKNRFTYYVSVLNIKFVEYLHFKL